MTVWISDAERHPVKHELLNDPIACSCKGWTAKIGEVVSAGWDKHLAEVSAKPMPSRYARYATVGMNDIVLQRYHQLDLGYTVDHDAAEHSPEELMRVGACYVDYAASEMENVSQDSPPGLWPETTIPWNPEATARGNAIKGAAFVAAALDLMHALEMEQDS